MKQSLGKAQLARLRSARRLLLDGSRPRDDESAARFVEERGFVLLMPIRGLPLPSLSEADGADPWAEDFRCTDRAWAWKETLPARRLCAYGKFIRGRGAFIGWRLYPSFYAVYGPSGDLEEEYEAGRLRRPDKMLVEMVADAGPISSHDLWIKAKPYFAGKRGRFLAALDRLQAGFFLTVAGGSLERWSEHYWDLVERQVPPGLLDRAPRPDEARRAVLLQTVENCAALPEKQLRSILRWEQRDLERTLRALLEAGRLREVQVEGEREPWLAADPAPPPAPPPRGREGGP